MWRVDIGSLADLSLQKPVDTRCPTMKYLAALALLAGSAAAFAPTALVSRTSALSMVPPNGTPAASHEEDLDKTFKVCGIGDVGA